MGLFNKYQKQNTNPNQGLYKENDYRDMLITKDIDKNIKTIYEMLGNSPDLKIRSFYLDKNLDIKIAFAYMNGLVNHEFINETVIDTIIQNYDKHREKIASKDLFNELKEGLLAITEITDENTLGKLFIGLLGGDTILFINGYGSFFVIGSRKYTERPVGPPTTHINVIGPKDSFTENILTNINLVRRRIRNPNLWTKNFVIGKDTNTNVVMMYMKGVASDSLITEVYNRLMSIEISNIIDASYIEAVIKDKQFCIFPTVFVSERPDVISANLLEGRIALLIDNSPFVLVVPTILIQFVQAAEDFYQKAYVATFYRLLRMASFYISILLPAIYVALVGVNAELIPFQLLVKIAGQREGLPFPSFVEALIMTLVFEILKEASTRIPKQLGSAITTAGALVLGQSAVEAGIISPVMVVVVSITAISTLVIPNYRLQNKISILKYFFLIIAAVFGIYGIAIGLILLFTHLCSIRSFGVSYYVPLAPFSFSGQKDSVLRSPIKSIFKRSKNFTKRYPN